MSNDLIHDVENAMRQERTERLWREYGPYILAGALLAVVLTAGISGYRAWAERTNQRNTALVIEALDSKQAPAQLAKIQGDLKPGQLAMDRLALAGQLIRDGKSEDALKQYQALGADRKAPAFYRDMGVWLSVRMDWSLHKSPAKAQPALDALQPLIDDTANPWNGHARLEAAEITAHGLNDAGKARMILAPLLTTMDAPDTLKQRAMALDHAYQLEQQTAAAPSSAATKKD